MKPGQIAMLVLGTLAVLAAAYVTTAFVATRGNRLQQGRNIRMLERTVLSKSQQICLFEVGDTVYLLAMTDGGATLLEKLERDQLAGQPQSFATKLVQRVVRSAQPEQPPLAVLRQEDDIDQLMQRLAQRGREGQADKGVDGT